MCALGGLSSSAASALPKALIDEQTVTGGTESQEAKIAEKDGFAVSVVSDATWGSMTQAEFGQYQLLIAGDPTCSTLPEGLITSASVYGPVVLGKAGGRAAPGNRMLVGTDPVFHDGGDFESPGARGTVIREGITFAGEESGRTGMYFDASCAGEIGQATQIVEILTELSTGSPAWTIDSEPPCGGNVSLIASNPSFSELTTESLEGWGCSVHESFPTFPGEWSVLAVATDTETHPVCGVDPGTGQEACGEPYLLIAGSGIIVKSGKIDLTPSEETNPVGTDHTVTAHVTNGSGTPLSGKTVTFTVTGQNAGATGTCLPTGCVTDASGNVAFTYHDTNGAGEDTVKASFTDESGSLQAATAKKIWAGTAAATTLTGKTASGDFADPTTVSAKLTNTATSNPVSGKSVKFTLDGSETCEGTTNASGEASCSITPKEAAGSYTLTSEFAGDSEFGASSGSANFEVTKEQTALEYTGATSAINGQPVTLSAHLTTDDPAAGTALAGKSVTFTLGTGVGAQTCTGITDSLGNASCEITSVKQAVGSAPVKAQFAGDTFYLAAEGSSSVAVFEPKATGAFVVGDLSVGPGKTVNFWGAQWARNNAFSGGSAPSSMKGFAESPQSLKCGATWTTRTGNSSAPPATLPSTINVIVSSKVTQRGSTISGQIAHIVVVEVKPGYGPAPGHPGNGKIIGSIC